MELYLDSANLTEIKEAFSLGGLSGLTTTPTFMHREGVKNLEQTILELSTIVPILQIEALGSDAKAIVGEAERLVDLGLDKSKTVFKIPVSIEGVKACYQMVKSGLMVNIHLVYTLQQAYMAMASGATYVCPLVGRLQDQGHDALNLVADCVEVVERYDYKSKIMFSSVRNVEHIKNALQVGAHACTVPWGIMQKLTNNHFTDIGTREFFEHTNLLTIKVKDVVARAPKVLLTSSLNDGLVQMTKSKLGAVAIVDENNFVKGIFTDGDLRRTIESKGVSSLTDKFSSFNWQKPVGVSPENTLDDALKIFKQQKIDTLIVEQAGKYLGMLDVQELLSVISQS
ncbi:MAG: CBS domain-containing protein [SAR324 cluster bacterium]|nr:CBS domain-containing protein [SAR324 cluster bacterium]